MQDVVIATIAILALCFISTHAMYITDDDQLSLDPPFTDSLDLESRDSDGLRKLLLKKLRFREIMKEHMKPPEEILASTSDEDEDPNQRHKAAKRHKMEDLMSRVQAYLNSMKERQIKESMSLPSLRFGRSGLNWNSMH